MKFPGYCVGPMSLRGKKLNIRLKEMFKKQFGLSKWKMSLRGGCGVREGDGLTPFPQSKFLLLKFSEVCVMICSKLLVCSS